MRLKLNIMDDAAIRRAIIRISHEILEKNRGASSICLVGIQRRGVYLARQIADTIAQIDGINVPQGMLDITHYRDDLSTIAEHPIIKNTDIPFALIDKNIILVDDVLQTGRTIRAAIEAVMEYGRPRTIQLAVLIDRGHRELPISANFVGKAISTRRDEIVSYSCINIDGIESVDLYEL